MPHARCLCGSVSWEIASGARLRLMHHCHCSMCRKAHGVTYATFASVARDEFAWTSGAERVVRHESAPGHFRPFCPDCGSSVPMEAADGSFGLPVAPLEGEFEDRPLAHIFVASIAPWHEITDELVCFDEYPEGYETPQVQPPERPVASPGAVSGSCLCAAVCFEASEIVRFANCHCLRCRRARGALHATNAFAPRGAFRWIRGEDAIRSWKVPEADRFTQAFCIRCGSPVPVVLPHRDLVTIPGGAFDGDPGVRPDRHIFCGSKAGWYDITDSLPQFEEYPPET